MLQLIFPNETHKNAYEKMIKEWLEVETMLSRGIQKAKELGINDILLTCDITNIPSNRTIIANGGKLERVTNDGDVNRYWVSV